MIIDCHAHLVPPSLLDSILSQAASFPSIRLIADGGSLGFSFPGGSYQPLPCSRVIWRSLVGQRRMNQR